MTTKRRQAIDSLRAADAALEAYTGPEGTPESRRLAAAVEVAYVSPQLPDRYRDPRDRRNAHKLRCRCQRPTPDSDGYCTTCGCPA
ncbi:MAG: hypothetical protein HOW97_18045 [Catenulispora sp.]|nr:hypothetical protein [Catenulispora sp.]